MARKPRKQSEGDIYHIVARGVGHCIIFEDDADRFQFLRLFTETMKTEAATVYAWCLMDNHYHALIRLNLERLSEAMKRVNASYAGYFNARYERDGHLFQGRFRSEPIDSDSYFLTALRYIHQNPVKAHISATCDYRWSSYGSYCGNSVAILPTLIDADLALDLMGSVDAFVRFHESTENDCCIECGAIDGGVRRLDDDDALEIARMAVAPIGLESIAGLPRLQRNAALSMLKAAGFSVRQIERYTGVSRSVVSRLPS